jgi:ATP-binding cassette subfamily F protein uup
VVTSTIAYEGAGNWREYEGGIQDWLVQSSRARKARAAAAPAEKPPQLATGKLTKKPAKDTQDRPANGKLSYKEQIELENLLPAIEALEREQSAVRAELASADLYQRDPARAAQLYARDAAIEEQMLSDMERWEELSARLSLV